MTRQTAITVVLMLALAAELVLAHIDIGDATTQQIVQSIHFDEGDALTRKETKGEGMTLQDVRLAIRSISADALRWKQFFFANRQLEEGVPLRDQIGVSFFE